MKKITIIIIFIIVTGFWNQGFTQGIGEVPDRKDTVRGPSIMDAPEVIDPFGKPVLFLSDGKGHIIIRPCDSNTISPEENSCKRLPDSHDFKMSKEEFIQTLELLLLIKTGNYTPEMERYLNVYQKHNSKGIKTALKEFSKSKEGEGSKRMSGISKIPKLTFELSENMSRWEQACIGANPHLGPPTDAKLIRQQIQKVNKKIEYLIKGIESAGLLMFYSETEKNKNFSFNILSSYLNFFEKTRLFIKKPN